MPPLLKGRILLATSYTSKATKGTLSFVICSVNRALDDLTQPSDEQRSGQHRMISEAVSHLKRFQLDDINEEWQDVGEETEAHNVFCGAIVIGNLPLVKSLLGSMPPDSVNRINPYFGIPLSIAAAWGQLYVARYLLICGANPARIVNLPMRRWIPDPALKDLDLPVGKYMYLDPVGSALRAAALAGHDDIVRLLVPYSQSPATWEEYYLAFQASARGGHLTIINILLHVVRKTIHELGWQHYQMLWQAVRHNQEAVVQMLLDHGIDVNMVPYSGPHALNIAAAQGHEQMVHLLLDRGSHVHLSESLGLSPIKHAAANGHQKIVEILLQLGANLDDTVISSASSGQAHLLKHLLLHKNVDLHKPLNKATVGVQALHLALTNRCRATSSILLDAGVLDSYSNPVDQLEVLPAEIGIGNSADGKIHIEHVCENWFNKDLWNPPHVNGIQVSKRTWQWVGRY